MDRLFPTLFLFLMIALSLPGPGPAQEWPPGNDGFLIPIILGPEGNGGGIGYIWHDLGREGRELYLYPVLADTDYRTYLLGYVEPRLVLDRGRLELTAFYQKRTGTHYFGIGPEARIEDGAYYQRENYLYRIGYYFPIGDHFEASAEFGYDRTVPRKSTLHNRNDFHEDYPELDRKLEAVYPQLLRSREWRDEFNHYWAVAAALDFRQGPENFPVRGGYFEARVARIDEAQGAQWNYWRYQARTGVFLPVGNEYTVLAAGARWDRLDGGEVPFYELPSLGQGRFSMSAVTDANGMRGVWENLWADRNRFLGSIELRHRMRAQWLPEPKTDEDGSRPLIDVPAFIRNQVPFAWLDVGQVWPDDEQFKDVRLAYGIGDVMYFDNGFNQQVTVGFSEDLKYYFLFTYGLQF